MNNLGSFVSLEPSIKTIEGAEEADNVDQQLSLFRGCVLEGRWDYVLPAYKNNSAFHKIKVNESRGTALHVAVNDGMVVFVNNLVDAIIQHEGGEVLRDDSALRSTDARGDTPLHLAASRGFIGMCKCIIGERGERRELIKVVNNKGETPLFRAVLMCQTMTFVYLHHVSKHIDVRLTNNYGDTILHHAIWREFLDLAIIILHCYPELLETRNQDGFTPLKVLACKPLAFKSGCNLQWWKQILYYCIIVEPTLEADKEIQYYMDKVGKIDKYEQHGLTVYIEKEPKNAKTFVEQKYVKSVRFIRSVGRLAFKALSLSGLGFTPQDLRAIKKMKQKHKWGSQLLSYFMKRPYESYMGISGGDQPFVQLGIDRNSATPFITQQQLQMEGESSSGQNQKENIRKDDSAGKNEDKRDAYLAVARADIYEPVIELQNKVPSSLPADKDNLLDMAMKNIKKKSAEHHVDKKETAFLAAAKNGIVEIVSQLLYKIPSCVHETNSNNENVLLVAAKNRQTKVVEMLKKNLDKEFFDCLILEVDNRDNTVLHIAAGFSSENKGTWQIAGAAIQIVLDIRWYEYIESLVQEHFSITINKDGETPWEIFEQKNKDKVKKNSEWLKETSSSCSTVAALVAGVSFAASTTLPGGIDKGKPFLEGEPAFDAFAIASLIALCFSVTALILFLAIYTSEKQLKDFRKSLPLKLLFGLTSLFLSITSMFISFCIAHFFVLKDKFKNKLFPLYIATCFPVILYAIVQFPFYFDLLKAIFGKLPPPIISNRHSKRYIL